MLLQQNMQLRWFMASLRGDLGLARPGYAGRGVRWSRGVIPWPHWSCAPAHRDFLHEVLWHLLCWAGWGFVDPHKDYLGAGGIYSYAPCSWTWLFPGCSLPSVPEHPAWPSFTKLSVSGNLATQILPQRSCTETVAAFTKPCMIHPAVTNALP